MAARPETVYEVPGPAGRFGRRCCNKGTKSRIEQEGNGFQTGLLVLGPRVCLASQARKLRFASSSHAPGSPSRRAHMYTNPLSQNPGPGNREQRRRVRGSGETRKEKRKNGWPRPNPLAWPAALRPLTNPCGLLTPEWCSTPDESSRVPAPKPPGGELASPLEPARHATSEGYILRPGRASEGWSLARTSPRANSAREVCSRVGRPWYRDSRLEKKQLRRTL